MKINALNMKTKICLAIAGASLLATTSWYVATDISSSPGLGHCASPQWRSEEFRQKVVISYVNQVVRSVAEREAVFSGARAVALTNLPISKSRLIALVSAASSDEKTFEERFSLRVLRKGVREVNAADLESATALVFYETGSEAPMAAFYPLDKIRPLRIYKDALEGPKNRAEGGRADYIFGHDSYTLLRNCCDNRREGGASSRASKIEDINESLKLIAEAESLIDRHLQVTSCGNVVTERDETGSMSIDWTTGDK